MPAVQSGKRNHFKGFRQLPLNLPTDGCVSIQTEVAMIIIGVLRVLFETTPKMLSTQYDEMVGKLRFYW